MTRPLRLHLPGGFYHVTLRGNHRQPIFRTPADRELLNEIVAEEAGNLGARIHAFCWMTNHVHALVQVSGEPLGLLVRRIASRYARKFQSRLETTGHLFERRHHAVLVDADSYLLTLVRYVHGNPVRGGLVRDPSDYPWSSHRDYLGCGRHGWVHTAFVLGMLSADASRARVAYVHLMGLRDEPKWGKGELAPNPANPQVLGGDEFLQRTETSVGRRSRQGNLEDLVAECAQRFRLSTNEIAGNSRSRDKSAARAWLAHEAVVRGIATVSAVARLLHRSEAALRGLMSRRPREAAGK